jgi:hypothetical protein
MKSSVRCGQARRRPGNGGGERRAEIDDAVRLRNEFVCLFFLAITRVAASAAPLVSSRE